MNSNTLSKYRKSCLTLLLAAVAVWGFLYLFLSFMMYMHTYSYENISPASFFKGGQNESLRREGEILFIEADMDIDAFDNYAKLDKLQFIPIGKEAIGVPCYRRFKSIHPSQRESFNNCKEDPFYYIHYVTTGFYVFDDIILSTPTYTRYLTVYDTENCRIFRFRGVPEWTRVPLNE